MLTNPDSSALPNDKTLTDAAPPEPLVADVDRLARLLDCSRRTIFKMLASGDLPRPIRLRRRAVWLVDEIRAWLAAGAPGCDRWHAIRRPEGGVT